MMDSNEAGNTSMPSIPRHVSEGYLTQPIRPSLRARSVIRSGKHQQYVTNRRLVVPTDAADTAQHPIRFQIETATNKHELGTERMHIDNAETELQSKRMAIARLKLDTKRAELEVRKAVAEATLASSGQRLQTDPLAFLPSVKRQVFLHNLSRTTPTPPTSPKSSRSAPSPPASGAHRQLQRCTPYFRCLNAVTNNAARIYTARTNNAARTAVARIIHAKSTNSVARTNTAKNDARTVRTPSGRPAWTPALPTRTNSRHLPPAQGPQTSCSNQTKPST